MTPDSLISLIQVMACHLVGVKPLPDSIQGYCRLEHQEQTLANYESKYNDFH